MTTEVWLVYLLAAIGLSISPGPSGLLVLTLGASLGVGRTSFAILGGTLGFLALIAASLAGMGALLATSEAAFTFAKWLGAAYLVYLGIRVWRSPLIMSSGEVEPEETARISSAQLVMRGFLVAVSNPKGMIFFAAFLPQFMMPGVSFMTNLLWLGGTFVLVEIACELIVAGLAQRIAPWLARYGRWFNRLTGGAFIGIGGALAMVNR